MSHAKSAPGSLSAAAVGDDGAAEKAVGFALDETIRLGPVDI